MAIRTKRIYDPPDPSDGARILVDRLWPRGVSREKAQVDEWMKEIAPSDRLRKWFNHDPERWVEFQKRYFDELHSPEKEDLLDRLHATARRKTLTLLFAAKDTDLNNAVALAAFLNRR